MTFSWTFTIIDGPIPTPTPLPEPSTIDRAGNLPDYIERVYPSPGETVWHTEDAGDGSDLQETWPIVPRPGQLPVCFALRDAELHELGELPGNHRDWPNRVFLQVDDCLLEEWLGSRYWYEEGWLSAHCSDMEVLQGEQIATLYIDPFDADLVAYSWAFFVEAP